LATGANVVMTTKGIDDLCLKYFVEAGAIAGEEGDYIPKVLAAPVSWHAQAKRTRR